MGGDGQALGNKRKLLDKQSSYLSATSAETGADEADKSANSKAETATRWKTCAISLEPLEAPICFDAAGHLFSKQSVISSLMARKSALSDEHPAADPFGIRRLSDVCEVVNADDNGEIRCPVSGFVASSGQHDFVGLWNCGHVVAASVVPSDSAALQESHVTKCPVCDVESFVVHLALSGENAEKQAKALRELLRKARKRNRCGD